MDTMPQLPAAGIGHISDNESTKDALTHTLKNNVDWQQTASFPYRAEYRRQPGLRFIHAGLATASLPDPSLRHGVRTSTGDRAGDCFYSKKDSELQDYYEEEKEKIYRSRQREPLGSSYIRGFSLPRGYQSTGGEGAHPDNIRFGITTISSESAKNLIYFPSLPDLKRAHGKKVVDNEYVGHRTAEAISSLAEYKQSAATELGGMTMKNQPLNKEKEITRQIDREYQWPAGKNSNDGEGGFDPSKHRFGKGAHAGQRMPLDSTGVAELLDDGGKATHIGSVRVEEFNRRTHDHLGHGKPVRGALLNLGDDFAFGTRVAFDDHGAKECVQGSYKIPEQQPDKDLGKSRPKLHSLSLLPNNAKNDPSRIFGVPSIRADRKAPPIKSVANDINYGDESDGKGLLYPFSYAWEGVNEEDFLCQRSPSEIRQIFELMGLQFKEKQFQRICEHAEKIYGRLSVDSFRHSWNKLRMESEEYQHAAQTMHHNNNMTQTINAAGGSGGIGATQKINPVLVGAAAYTSGR